MDAHLFRRFCEDLVPALIGVRIEKIHQLCQGITVFTLYGMDKLRLGILQEIPESPSLFSEKKQYLFFKEGRDPLLFFSPYRPSLGNHPPAPIMRLRKYLVGKRIERVLANWVERKLYLEIQGHVWLCFDLRKGLELILTRPESIFHDYSDNFTSSEHDFEFREEDKQKASLLPFSESYSVEPRIQDIDFSTLWPKWEQVYTWCMQNFNSESDQIERKSDNFLQDEVWRNFPVLTPLFRKTIPYLDKEEGAALYADLQYGGGDIALYLQNSEKNLSNNSSYAFHQTHRFEISPWLLPKKLAEKMGFSSTNSRELLFEESISALTHAGEFFLTALSQNTKNALVKPLITEAKRLDKLLEKLDKEEERLQNMLAKKSLALLLQANLYRLETEKKEKNIILINEENQTVSIELDPSKNIGQNMEHFFHVSRRGKRGLEHLQERRKQVIDQKEKALQSALEEKALQKGFETQKNENKSKTLVRESAIPRNTNLKTKFPVKKAPKNLVTNSNKNKQKFPSHVQAFRSSDGFLILRGRDTKGNALVLKMANPHDYWVHVAEGTGAHVIIRRDHPKQEVPEKTLQEAGTLALLKSWKKDDAKGLAQYSLAKYIRPMKSANQGLVHVDKSEGTFSTEINVQIEQLLSMP